MINIYRVGLVSFAIIFLLAMILISPSADSEMMKYQYKTEMGNQVFHLTVPLQPVKGFARNKPKVSLEDKEIFNNTGGLELINFSWIYSKTGILRKDEGAFELKVFLRPSQEYDVSEIGGLRDHLLSIFQRRYGGQGVDISQDIFDEVPINNRMWVKYRVPTRDINAYATGLSKDRYLVVQLLFVDNTGESSPLWLDKAYELAADIISNLRIE